MKHRKRYLLYGVILLTLVACSKAPSTQDTNQSNNKTEVTPKINGMDLPIEDILVQARKVVGNAVITSIDYENANPNCYEVEAYLGNTKYDLQLDAKTGEIYKQSEVEQASSIVDGVEITIDEAIAIAAAQSNGGLVHSIHLDQTEAGMVYEVEAIKNHKTQDIELSATDGKVLSFEEESTY